MDNNEWELVINDNIGWQCAEKEGKMMAMEKNRALYFIRFIVSSKIFESFRDEPPGPRE